jgi:hypothetical protein
LIQQSHDFLFGIGLDVEFLPFGGLGVLEMVGFHNSITTLQK